MAQSAELESFRPISYRETQKTMNKREIKFSSQQGKIQLGVRKQ